LLVFWPYSVWTKSIMCKRCCTQGFHFQSDVSRFYLQVRRNFKFPVNRPDNRAIPSGRLLFLFHSSERRVIPSGHRQSSIIRPDDVLFPSGPLHCIEKVLSSLHPSRRFSSTSGRLSVLERFFLFFPSSKKGKINKPSRRCGIPSRCVSR